MASHIDAPRSAVELRSILRSMHFLRRFGPLLLQSLAIYRLLASSCCVRYNIYGVLGHFCSKGSLFTGFWLTSLRPAQLAGQVHISKALHKNAKFYPTSMDICVVAAQPSDDFFDHIHPLSSGANCYQFVFFNGARTAKIGFHRLG